MLSILNLTEPEVKKRKLSDNGSFYIIYSPGKIKIRHSNSECNVKLKIKAKLTRQDRGSDWIITWLCFQKTFNRQTGSQIKEKTR